MIYQQVSADPEDSPYNLLRNRLQARARLATEAEVESRARSEVSQEPIMPSPATPPTVTPPPATQEPVTPPQLTKMPSSNAPVSNAPIAPGQPVIGEGRVDSVYGPDGRVYASPAAAINAGVYNYTMYPPNTAEQPKGLVNGAMQTNPSSVVPNGSSNLYPGTKQNTDNPWVNLYPPKGP